MKVFRKTISAVMALAMAATGAVAVIPGADLLTATQVFADEASEAAYSISLTDEKFEQSSLKTLAYYKKNDLYKCTVAADAVDNGSLDNNLVAEVKLKIDKNNGFYLSQFYFEVDSDLTFVGCANYQKEEGATVSNFKDIPDSKVSVSAYYNKVLVVLDSSESNPTNITETGEFLTLLFALPEKPEANKAYKIAVDKSTEMVPWDDSQPDTIQSKAGSITITDGSSGDTPAQPSDVLKGDFDLDGKVTQIDATYMLRYTLESSIVKDEEKQDVLINLIKDNITGDLAKESKETIFAKALANADVDGSEGGKTFKQSDATFILRALLDNVEINNAYWDSFFKK